MIADKVKLVVWDLDDTFWQGTLGEGAVTTVGRNVEIVRALARRGIVSAICSKNDFDAAKSKLAEIGIWDHFVFPRIAFAPKGQAVADVIEAAALRAQNVLFLDDNAANLEEVRFFNPGIMAAHPAEALGGLLDHPHLAGEPDPELTRLAQYRLLERKHEERAASPLSNEDFLRASRIRVTIGYDVEADFERVVELINRANQLNYTKRRLETAESVARFRKRLRNFSTHAGTVCAADAYGDYGLIGFFLVNRRAHETRLVHFVFSCRTMNMGIEQYVYDLLGRPGIEIVPPVAYGPASHAKIDWIAEAETGEERKAQGAKLLLLGGCDLLQLAAYCGSDRLEFVNTAQSGTMVRYDDPGFVLSDREAVRGDAVLREIPSWTYEDAMRFDAAVGSRGMIILSLWSSMNGSYFRTKAGVLLRMNKPQQRFCRRLKTDGWFAQHLSEIVIDDAARLALMAEALDSVAARSRGTVFVLGCNTRGGANPARRRAYNQTCLAHCEKSGGRLRYVDVDAIVPAEHLLDDTHFSRPGYHALARHILAAS